MALAALGPTSAIAMGRPLLPKLVVPKLALLKPSLPKLPKLALLRESGAGEASPKRWPKLALLRESGAGEASPKMCQWTSSH